MISRNIFSVRENFSFFHTVRRKRVLKTDLPFNSTLEWDRCIVLPVDILCNEGEEAVRTKLLLDGKWLGLLGNFLLWTIVGRLFKVTFDEVIGLEVVITLWQVLVNVVQVEDLVLIRGLVFAWKVVDDNDDVEDDVVVPFVFLSGTVIIAKWSGFFFQIWKAMFDQSLMTSLRFMPSVIVTFLYVLTS